MTTAQDFVQRLSTAAHELGHAFAGRHGGLIVAELVVTGPHEGECAWRGDRVPASQTWDVAVALGGGEAAELLYRQEHHTLSPGLTGSVRDQQNFDYLRRESGDDWPGGFWPDAVEDARKILAGVWDELLPLVPVLATTGRLTGI